MWKLFSLAFKSIVPNPRAMLVSNNPCPHEPRICVSILWHTSVRRCVPRCGEDDSSIECEWLTVVTSHSHHHDKQGRNRGHQMECIWYVDILSINCCKMGFSKFLQCAFLCGSHLLQSASLDQRLDYEGDIVSRYAFSSSTFSPFVRLAFWKYVYTRQDRGGNASSWFSMIRELLSSGPTRCYATLWNKQIVILTGI